MYISAMPLQTEVPGEYRLLFVAERDIGFIKRRYSFTLAGAAKDRIFNVGIGMVRALMIGNAPISNIYSFEYMDDFWAEIGEFAMREWDKYEQHNYPEAIEGRVYVLPDSLNDEGRDLYTTHTFRWVGSKKTEGGNGL